MIDDALAALREGKFILLYDFDDREGETDFAIRSDAVTPKDIVRMRKDGGGLICTAVHPVAAQRLGLPFASDALRAIAVAEREGDIPYDRKNHSSFSLWVNHRNTFTGITDRDRALTVNAIAEQVKRALNGGGVNFHETFRTRATWRSCGQRTGSSMCGAARPSSQSQWQTWRASRRQSRSARCWTTSPAMPSPKRMRNSMAVSTGSCLSRDRKCWSGGKLRKAGRTPVEADPFTLTSHNFFLQNFRQIRSGPDQILMNKVR